MSTPSEDRITVIILLALLGGLWIDGHAHAHLIDGTETFFTPWHALFYAAFVALCGWIFSIGYRRRTADPIITWFPAAYRPSIYALGIFAVGGVGDAIWHEIFGVEFGIGALLSPTHLVMFSASLLLVWTGMRATVARGDESVDLAIGSVLLTTGYLMFFTEYLFFVSEPWVTTIPYDIRTDENWQTVALFNASSVVTVLVLVGPLLMITRRWSLPAGTATVIWGIWASVEALAIHREWTGIVAAIAGGIVFDVCYRLAPFREYRLQIAAFLGPAAMVGAFFVAAEIDVGVEWPPEIWGGSMMTVAFTGLGLVALQTSGRHARLGPA